MGVSRNIRGYVIGSCGARSFCARADAPADPRTPLSADCCPFEVRCGPPAVQCSPLVAQCSHAGAAWCPLEAQCSPPVAGRCPLAPQCSRHNAPPVRWQPGAVAAERSAVRRKRSAASPNGYGSRRGAQCGPLEAADGRPLFRQSHLLRRQSGVVSSIAGEGCMKTGTFAALVLVGLSAACLLPVLEAMSAV